MLVDGLLVGPARLCRFHKAKRLKELSMSRMAEHINKILFIVSLIGVLLDLSGDKRGRIPQTLHL